MMSGIDGWTVLTAIKGDPTLADIPVVLMTIVDEKSRGFSLGAAEYLGQARRSRQADGGVAKYCRRARRRVLLD